MIFRRVLHAAAAHPCVMCTADGFGSNGFRICLDLVPGLALPLLPMAASDAAPVLKWLILFHLARGPPRAKGQGPGPPLVLSTQLAALQHRALTAFNLRALIQLVVYGGNVSSKNLADSKSTLQYRHQYMDLTWDTGMSRWLHAHRRRVHPRNG